MKKNKVILTAIILVIFCIQFFYQPIEENKIYRREIRLTENTEVMEASINNNKMVKRAKNTLENVFSVEIDENAYEVNVSYKSKQISNERTAYGIQTLSFTSIYFKERSTGNSQYTVECDTTSGEILMIAQNYKSSQGSAYMPIKDLEKAAKTFLEKITSLKQSEILYIDGAIQANNYCAKITLEKSYETVVLYLDAFDGTVFYYLKVT